MTSNLTVQTAGTVSRDCQIRDYDQLDPEAKQFLAELADDETAITVPARVARCFDRREVINFTEYIRIEL
jgi:hypothetical protein